MSLDEDKYKKQILTNQEIEDESGEGGTSGTGEGAAGASGQIAFKDFLATERLREDLLPEELRRLLSVHQDTHELNVKKQKDLREQRQAVKEGKINLQAYRNGLGGGGANSNYRPNPVLADKAQFSGIDRQVNQLPTDNAANTNEGDRDKLENEYRLRHALTPQPSFNPKPQFNR